MAGDVKISFISSVSFRSYEKILGQEEDHAVDRLCAVDRDAVFDHQRKAVADADGTTPSIPTRNRKMPRPLIFKKLRKIISTTNSNRHQKITARPSPFTKNARIDTTSPQRTMRWPTCMSGRGNRKRQKSTTCSPHNIMREYRMSRDKPTLSKNWLIFT